MISELAKMSTIQCTGQLKWVGEVDTASCVWQLGSPHPELQKLTDALKHIRFSGQETSLEDVAIDIRKLLPEDVTSYWTYEGSLTTPPYNDCVTWIVLKNHVEISEEQVRVSNQHIIFTQTA